MWISWPKQWPPKFHIKFWNTDPPPYLGNIPKKKHFFLVLPYRWFALVQLELIIIMFIPILIILNMGNAQLSIDTEVAGAPHPTWPPAPPFSTLCLVFCDIIPDFLLWIWLVWHFMVFSFLGLLTFCIYICKLRTVITFFSPWYSYQDMMLSFT